MRRLRIRLILCMALFCVPFFHTAAQLNKDYFFWAGRNYLIDSKYQDAIEILNVLLKSDSSAYEGYFLRGVAKYNLEDYLGAEQDFSTSLRKNPVYTMAYQYRAITRSIIGNYDDALQDFGEAIALRPDIAGPYYSRGITFLMNRQFDRAVEDLTHFIRQEDRVADAYLNRGVAYLHMNDTVRALEDFEAGIRTNREYSTGYIRRGSLYMDQEKYNDALADFDMAIRYDSANLQAYFNRSLVRSRTDRPLDAIKDLDELLSIDSTSSVSYFNRAILKSQIGAYNDALADYDRVAYYSPNNVLVYYNRGALYAQLGDMESAENDYTRAIELYPDFANAYLRRSGVRLFLRDRDGSQRDEAIANAKIAEYRSRLTDSMFSIYADTSKQFNSLLSFDARVGARKNLDLAAVQGSTEVSILPMFRFSFVKPSSSIVTVVNSEKYYVQRVEDFKSRINSPYLGMVNTDSDLSPDSLVTMDRRINDSVSRGHDSWELLFLRGVSQTLVKQYTNAIASYTAAIDLDPANPFLYINRSTTQSEMIDFISSLDNSYQRITPTSDPANRLRAGSSRMYNYDSAIADLNKAARLMPEYAVIYYNRANLLWVSGFMTEAIDDYTKAIELNPMFGEAYYNRGLIQIYLKDTRKGSLDLGKAGELGIAAAYQALRLYGEIN